jgi:hypothetical protein
MKYSVRKWYYVDTIVEADSLFEANDIVNEQDCDLKNLEYFGDIDGQPDIAEIE